MSVQTAKPARAKKVASALLALVLAFSFISVTDAFGMIGVAEATGEAGVSESSDSAALAAEVGSSGKSQSDAESTGESSLSEEGAEQGPTDGSVTERVPETEGKENADGTGGAGSLPSVESAPGTDAAAGSGEEAGASEGEVDSSSAEQDEPAAIDTLDALSVGTLQGLSDALRDASDGDVITLTADIVVTKQVNLSTATAKSVTIDGTNPSGTNFSITRGGSFAGYMIRIDNGNGLTFENVTLDGAHVASARAHVYLTAGSLTLGSGSILQNSSSSGSGGAVAAVGGTVTVGSGAIVRNNYATGNGGGINMTAGSLVLESGSLIEGNTAGGDGGGVNLYTGNSGTSPVSLNMAGGAAVAGNSAVNGGGVVVRLMTASDAVSVAGTISGNSASNHGGGLYLNPRNASTPPIALASATLEKNTATGVGGGLYVADSNPIGSLEINGLSASGNTAKDGGGVYIYHRDAAVSYGLRVVGATISGNTVTGLGGGLYLASEGIVDASFAQTTVQSNQAGNQGGGLWIIGRGSASTHAVTLKDRTVLSGNSADTAGGLYYRASSGTSSFTMTGATVDANEAITAAGGIRLQGVDAMPMQARIDHASVSSNTQSGASESGGAGILLNAADLVLGEGSVVRGNTATARGGGVYSSKSNITMEQGSEVAGNTAQTHNGGGFFLTGVGTLAAEAGSTIAGNRAANGGGVFGSGATVDLAGSVTGNTASSRGGGVHVAYEGRLEVRTGAAIDSNSALDGGGVALSSFSEGAIAGSVSDNRADRQGGGILYGWPWGSSSTPAATSLELAATASIERNAAAEGAGLYAAGAGNGVTDTRVTLNGAKIAGNTAFARGGGIFVEKATLDMLSGLVSGNASDDNLGHDLWVDPELPAGSASEGGVVNLSVSEDSFTDDADRDKVLIGAGASGKIVFLRDFTMKNHLLLQNDGPNRSTVSVETGAKLVLSGKLTVGIADDTTSHTLVVDPNGGSVFYRNDAEAEGSDPITGETIADMHAFPGSSTSVYLQWPDQAPNRADEPFKGWSDDGGTVANRGVEYLDVAGDTTATALWGAYSIQYFDDDGTTELTSLAPSEYAFGTETTALPQPAKDGFRFVAWYEDADRSGNPVESFANSDREDKAYFAKWETAPTPPTPPDPGPTPDPDPDPDPQPEPQPSPTSDPGSGGNSNGNAGAAPLPGSGSGLAVTGDALIGFGALGIVVALAGAILFAAHRRRE